MILQTALEGKGARCESNHSCCQEINTARSALMLLLSKAEQIEVQ